MQVSKGYCDTPVCIGGADYYLVFMVRVRPGSFRKARKDVPIWVVPDCDDVRIIAILLFRQAHHRSLPEACSLSICYLHSQTDQCRMYGML